MSKLLQVNHVSKYYGMGTVVTRALDDISFAMDKGEFTAIMGTSASECDFHHRPGERG